jgi:hypothetical protein
LAHRLRQPDARLILVLGAEAWCEKCRQFRPLFEARATQAAPHETWLWLDLEEHAEFLGDYLPQNLPQLLVYEGGRIIRHQTIEPTDGSLEAALYADLFQENLIDPGLNRQFMRDDWAQ